jgi:hypothetical protein
MELRSGRSSKVMRWSCEMFACGSRVSNSGLRLISAFGMFRMGIWRVAGDCVECVMDLKYA